MRHAKQCMVQSFSFNLAPAYTFVYVVNGIIMRFRDIGDSEYLPSQATRAEKIGKMKHFVSYQFFFQVPSLALTSPK